MVSVDGRAKPVNPPRNLQRERHMQRSIVQCTPQIAFGDSMQQYIEAQTQAAKKQWVYEIVEGEREVHSIIHQDADCVVVPDIDYNTSETANWLVIFKDTSLHSIRDLRGHHVELLQHVRDTALRLMQERLGFSETQVMCYFHYLPSVFQLHLHVCAPYGHYTTSDILKIQTIDSVISNLVIDPFFYEKATITTVIIGKGELNSIYEKVS